MSGNFTTSFAAVSAQVQKIREQKQLQSQNQSPSPPVQQRASPQPSSSAQQQQQAQQEPHPKKQRINAFHNPNSSNSGTIMPSTSANVKAKPPTLLVNKTQTGNPLLQNLTNINWSYTHSSSPYDYLTNGRRIMFLSLKYHKLHPEYLQRKIDLVTKGTEGKDSILIVVVDVENHDTILKEINKICVYEGITMLCAFGFAEAGKWIGCLARGGK